MRRQSIRVNPIILLALCVMLAASLTYAQDSAVRINSVEARDAVVTKVDPKYPEMARKMKLSGTVKLTAVISESGKVESVKVMKGNPLLTGSARMALKQWKFTPIERDGKPVRASCDFAFNFTE
jgi:TonB family protein